MSTSGSEFLFVTRFFGVAMAPGDVFSIDLDPDTTASLFSIELFDGTDISLAFGWYTAVGGFGVADAGETTAPVAVAATDEGLRVEVAILDGNGSYRLTVAPRIGPPLVHTGTLLGSGAPTQLRVAAAGDTSPRQHHFNSITVPEPGGVAAALTAAAALALRLGAAGTRTGSR